MNVEKQIEEVMQMIDDAICEAHEDELNAIRAKLRAILSSRCLHQLEEPSSAHPAEGVPAPEAAAVTNEDLQDLVSKALRRAWQLGQTYWQQADSEYISQHKKADDTQAKFSALIEETRAEIAATQPAAQGLDIPDSPHLGDHWKAALLDGRTLERDENGMGWHPALPSFDEATDTRKFYEAFGMEICQVSAESELEWEEYDRLTGLEPNGEFNFSEWTPKAPEGEGWKLVSIHDTEDGPYAWWLRDAALASQAKQGGAA